MTLYVYIARQFAAAILFTLGGLMTLVILLDTVELTRRTTSKDGVNFLNVLEMAILKAPEMSLRILPFAVLIGGMVALTRLNRSSELVAARAAGVSVWQFLMPAWSVALIIGLLFITIVNPIASAMLSRYEQLEARYISGKASMMTISDSGLWLRDFEEINNESRERIFHAKRLNQNTLALEKVIMFQYGSDSEFLGRIDADEARLKEGRWQLEQVVQSKPGKPPQLKPELGIKTDLTLEQIQDSFASPETLSFWQLPSFIGVLEAAGFSAIRHKLHFQTMLALPLLLAGMIFIAATFSLHSPRRSRVPLLVASGVLSGFVIYFLSDLIHAMGLSGSLPLLIAAWIPPFATALGGIWMMIHLENG